MSKTLNDNFHIAAGKSIDKRYLNGTVPYASIVEVEAMIPLAERYLGLTVLIVDQEFYFEKSIADGSLKAKPASDKITLADTSNTSAIVDSTFLFNPIKKSYPSYIDSTSTGQFPTGNALLGVFPSLYDDIHLLFEDYVVFNKDYVNGEVVDPLILRVFIDQNTFSVETEKFDNSTHSINYTGDPLPLAVSTDVMFQCAEKAGDNIFIYYRTNTSSDGFLYKFNINTKVCTRYIANGVGVNNGTNFTVSSDNTALWLYGTNGITSGTLAKFDIATGTLTFYNNESYNVAYTGMQIPLNIVPTDVIFNPTNNKVYFACGGTGSVGGLVELDPATNILTIYSQSTGNYTGAPPSSTTFSSIAADGNYIYCGLSNGLWRFDVVSHIGMVISTTGIIGIANFRMCSSVIDGKIYFANQTLTTLRELDIATLTVKSWSNISNVPAQFSCRFWKINFNSYLSSLLTEMVSGWFGGVPTVLVLENFINPTLSIGRNGLVAVTVGFNPGSLSFKPGIGLTYEALNNTNVKSSNDLITLGLFKEFFNFYGFKVIDYIKYRVFVHDNVTPQFGPFILKRCTAANLPSANLHKDGILIYDNAGIQKLIFSNGAGWKYADGTNV
jgi:hypothetical protein